MKMVGGVQRPEAVPNDVQRGAGMSEQKAELRGGGRGRGGEEKREERLSLLLQTDGRVK